MSSSQKILVENLQIARTLFTQPFKRNRLLPKTDIVNPKLCDRVLDKLALEKDYMNTNLIDMNPGLGQFSAALHNRIKPRTHTLLEPNALYHEHLQKRFGKKYPNMTFLNLNGYDWDTYEKIFKPELFSNPALVPQPSHTPPESGLNHDLLFVGNFTRIVDSRRVVSQLLSTCYLHSWLQQYGRVRFLLWMHNEEKERILPPQVQSRTRPSVIADACCDVTEIASAGGTRSGKGFQVSQLTADLQDALPQSVKRRPKTLDDRLRFRVRKTLDLTERWRATASKRGAGARKTQQRVREIEEQTASELRKYFSHRNGEGASAESATLSLDDLLQRFKDTEGVPPPEHKEKNEEITQEQRTDFAEFEELFIIPTAGEVPRQRSIFDEQYARTIHPPLLQAWQERNTQPLSIDTDTDTFPAKPLTLLDFQPRLMHEFFQLSPGSKHDTRNRRYLTFDWIVRNLFTLRAQSTKVALKGLVPGGEYLLDEIPGGKGTDIGQKRVRTLTVEEMIEIAKAWEKWPFKPDDEGEWGGYSRASMERGNWHHG